MIEVFILTFVIAAVAGFFYLMREAPDVIVEDQHDKMTNVVRTTQNFTKEELRQYNGENDKPIYMAVRGQVFDVTSGSGFYGPGGPYFIFAGNDATIGLATMEMEPAKWTKTSISELTASELDTVEHWNQKFESKYDIVGYLVDGVDAKRKEDMEKTD